MIGQSSTTLSGCGVNIAHMTDKSRGEFAYGLVDVDNELGKDVLDKICAIEGVTRVRLISAKNFCKKF